MDKLAEHQRKAHSVANTNASDFSSVYFRSSEKARKSKLQKAFSLFFFSREVILKLKNITFIVFIITQYDLPSYFQLVENYTYERVVQTS